MKRMDGQPGFVFNKKLCIDQYFSFLRKYIRLHNYTGYPGMRKLLVLLEGFLIPGGTVAGFSLCIIIIKVTHIVINKGATAQPGKKKESGKCPRPAGKALHGNPPPFPKATHDTPLEKQEGK